MTQDRAGADASRTVEIDEILRYLPHRYPLLLIDRVIELVPDERVVAIKNVTINEPYFVGHFPHHPVMPGVLVVEAMAQAAGVLSFATLQKYSDPTSVFYFAGIDAARFKRPVIPGDQLRFEVSILRRARQIWKFGGRALVDGQLVAEAQLMCALRDLPGAQPQSGGSENGRLEDRTGTGTGAGAGVVGASAGVSGAVSGGSTLVATD